jgi:hypothetical protein
MLSIIHSTINEPSEYKHLFVNSCKDAELIIIDSKWSEERKKQVKNTPNFFKSITYAPPKERKQKMFCDFLSSHNTGLSYADEPLCMCMGGENELCPDFYERLREDIDNFGYGVAFRPLELEASQDDVKWVSYVRYPWRYFMLPTYPLGKDSSRSHTMIQTCGFFIMIQKYWYSMNGFDERYDIGGHWYDNDLFTRACNIGLDVVFDQKLMVYRYPHTSAFATSKTTECVKLYKETTHDTRAPNPFDLRELHEESMGKKAEYMI